MTTLHDLRRTYALSFSELAVLTAIPVRRLAEFEYHGIPLSQTEQHSIAAFFGVADQALEGGFVSRHATQPTLTKQHAQAFAMLTVTAALAWSLRVAQPAMGDMLDNMRNMSAASLPFSLVEPATATPTTVPTATPTMTPSPTATATMTPSPTMTPTATPEPTPTTEPSPTPTAVPTAQPKPIQPQLETSSGGVPHRCPVVPARGRVVITQGYGVGTHAPAAQWGALDLAVGGGVTQGTTVVASHSGHVRVALNTWPAGNFVSVSGDEGWRTSYSHLQTVLVQSGDYVEAGTPIGTIGSTGHSTGPHLDYQTWHNGVNVDPSPVLSCK